MTTTSEKPAGRRGVGRPKLPDSEKRSVCIRSWLTPAEAAAVEAAAASRRESVSRYTARTIVAAAGRALAKWAR